MADAYTTAATLQSDTAAYEALAYFGLRPELPHDECADVKPTAVTHRGASVQFFLYDDFAAQTATLSETADPDAIAPSDQVVIVTPLEKGALVKTTAKIRHTSLLDIDADMANLIGWNAGLTSDTLARDELVTGTNVTYQDSTSVTTIAATDKLTAATIEQQRAELASASVRKFSDGNYKAFIHPKVAYDIMRETGAGWRDPHTYSSPEAIFAGEIGRYAGFRFYETERARVLVDASNGAGAAGTVDVYSTLFTGRQALACAYWGGAPYGRYPAFVRGEVVDGLKRIQPMGWKHAIGYKVFRNAALRRVESASTIGSN